MINTPSRPTEKYILGRISFHEDQAGWFTLHDQPVLAAWARSVMEEWSKKLEALKGNPPQEIRK